MTDAEPYGPALPPVVKENAQAEDLTVNTISPELPPGFMKHEHVFLRHAPAFRDSCDHSMSGDVDIGSSQPGDTVSMEGGVMPLGPMVSEMTHSDEVVQAAEEFERRSRRMKEHLTVKAEAQPGKREEWMTELPAEMSKNIGVTARTFGTSTEIDIDRSSWTDLPADRMKGEKQEGKNKKRKREDTEKGFSKQRDDQLQQQVDEYNKKKRSESLLELHQKSRKKKNHNSIADSPEPQTTATQVQTQTQTQTLHQLSSIQQHHLQNTSTTEVREPLQYMQLTDDIRDSLDLLSSEQKSSEYFTGEYSQAVEFNESKPLADLLMNPNMVGYNAQDGTLLPQNGALLGSSHMIAQAYNQAQHLSTPLSQQQYLASGLSNQVGGQMGITIIPAQTPDGHTSMHDGQPATIITDESHASSLIHAINGANYAGEVVGGSQSAGSATFSAFSLGQNVIIASPGNGQHGGNYIFTSTCGQMVGNGIGGQNIVIAAAAGQQGGYLVKPETQEELAQTLVLASQHPQSLGAANLLMGTSINYSGGLGDGISVSLNHPQTSFTPTCESHSTGKAETAMPRGVAPSMLPSSSAVAVQSHGTVQPVSLVLPSGGFLPQLQGMVPASGNSHSFSQLSIKLDKVIIMMQETARAINEVNKRLDRLESNLAINAQSSKTKKKSPSSTSLHPSSMLSASEMVTPPSFASGSPGQSKSDLKAALADYLTISDYNNKDDLKREASSDLFIPVGTVSLPIHEDIGSGCDTATSTVADLPERNLLLLNNAAPVPLITSPGMTMGSNTINHEEAAPDSQSGMAVTIYDTEGATYELGPDSSKDNVCTRFTTVSQNPKTVIVDPKFWEMLVEDFQKNMTSKQIMSALGTIRKPLVRNMGNNEISICSSVLKEAEEACQGRRERLAKELVFRIFTLGEVYDRNVSGVFYIKGKKMENKLKALDPAKMSAIRFLVMRYPPSVLDNPRLEKLVWKNCVDRINDALRRIYNWIHKLVDINSIADKLPTQSVLQ